MVTNEELNVVITQLRKATLRAKAIDSLLRAAEAEYKNGGLEKGIYFATKGIIGGLRTYLAAAEKEENRLVIEYTRLVGEEVAVRAVENYRHSLKERRASKNSVAVQEPVKATVAKRQYNRNGTK